MWIYNKSGIICLQAQASAVREVAEGSVVPAAVDLVVPVEAVVLEVT